MGLRWWSNVREDGTTEWMFESLEDMSEISSADYKLFWIGLYGTPILWVCLLITGIMLLKFQWLVIVVIALLLSGANIYGYTKCNADAKNKASALIDRSRPSDRVILSPIYYRSIYTPVDRGSVDRYMCMYVYIYTAVQYGNTLYMLLYI